MSAFPNASLTVFPLALSAPESEYESPAHKIAFRILLVFVFFLMSRVLDNSVLLSRLHLPLILALLTLLAAVVSGALKIALETRMAKYLGAMTGWMILTIPFAFWRGGSFGLVFNSWLQRTVLISLLVAGLTVTVKEVASLMNVIALTSFAAAVTGLRSGVASNENRLFLQGGSNIANPNDMAFAVLLGIPFCLLFIQAGGLGRKVLGLAALAPMLACFLKTGSRAGMLAFCTMALVTFLRASIGGKLKIVVAAVLIGVMGFAILPPSLRQRYITLKTAEEGADERVLEIAASSTASREALLRQALKITATHPLFGVGPGNFTYVENKMEIDNGARKGMWQEAHDTYAQLAADCGIPALIIFVCLLGSSIRSVAAVRKRLANDSRPLARQIMNAAQASETLLWGMVVFMFFGHMAYAPVVYLLIALAMVVARAANREVPALAAVPQAPLAMPARHWVAAS